MVQKIKIKSKNKCQNVQKILQVVFGDMLEATVLYRQKKFIIPGFRGEHINIFGPVNSFSGKKKEHKLKFLWLRISSVGGFRRQGMGVKKFGMSLETQENQIFGGIPGFLLGYPGGARKA